MRAVRKEHSFLTALTSWTPGIGYSHRGKGFYGIYQPSDDSREVDKCHRNRTEVYNALLPCQTLLRNILYFCSSKMHSKTLH